MFKTLSMVQRKIVLDKVYKGDNPVSDYGLDVFLTILEQDLSEPGSIGLRSTEPNLEYWLKELGFKFEQQSDQVWVVSWDPIFDKLCEVV